MNSDHATYYGTKSEPNPYEKDAPTFTDEQIRLATEDVLDELLKDDEEMAEMLLNTFSVSAFESFFANVSLIMSCQVDDRSEHIDALKELFKRPLAKRASAMALEQLTKDANDE